MHPGTLLLLLRHPLLRPDPQEARLSQVPGRQVVRAPHPRASELVADGSSPKSCCSPLFVTWNTRSSRPGRPSRLRGCIGTFEPQPLRDGLAEYALISAFRDSRFKRIEEWELENLECKCVPCPVSRCTDLMCRSAHRPSVSPASVSLPSPRFAMPCADTGPPTPTCVLTPTPQGVPPDGL